MSERHDQTARGPSSSPAVDPTERFASQFPRRPDVRPGRAFDPWHLRVLSAAEFDALGDARGGLSELQLVYLASFGTLAPTTHNTVPQRFQFSAQGKGIAVWLDRKFVLPASDSRGRQATISCGCAVAHLDLAASAYGWRAAIHPCPVEPTAVLPFSAAEPRYVELARLSLERGSARPEERRWLDAMLERKNLRADFDPCVQLDDDLVQELKSVVAKFAGLKMHMMTDATTLAMLGKFQELADTTVYNREQFARELGHWLLQNDADALVGMRGSEFGLSDDAARHFHRGLRGEEPLLPDEIAALAKVASRAVRSASAVGVLCAESDSTAARLNAGRAFAELTLALQQHGLSTAVHAAITEVEAANLALRGRLRTSWRPVVLFRVGRPARESDRFRPHSARPPTQDLIFEDGFGRGHNENTRLLEAR